MKRRRWPDQEESTRPYRLLDTKAENREKPYVRWRCYASPHSAHDGIWDVMKWYSDPGRTIELVNINTHKVLCTYTLQFKDGKFGLVWV